MFDFFGNLLIGLLGVVFLCMDIIQISERIVYPQRGGRLVFADKSPVAFWILIFVQFAGGIALIGLSVYNFRKRFKK